MNTDPGLYHRFHCASNDGPCKETGPLLLGHGFYIMIKKEMFRNLFVPNHKG